LRNGLPLDISKKHNVDIEFVKNSNMHITMKNKAVENLEKIQDYYDFIKKHMKKKPQSSSVFYLKYKRKQFMCEKEINE